MTDDASIGTADETSVSAEDEVFGLSARIGDYITDDELYWLLSDPGNGSADWQDSQLAAVPEPSSLVIFLSGFLALAGSSWNNRRIHLRKTRVR